MPDPKSDLVLQIEHASAQRRASFRCQQIIGNSKGRRDHKFENRLKNLSTSQRQDNVTPTPIRNQSIATTHAPIELEQLMNSHTRS